MLSWEIMLLSSSKFNFKLPNTSTVADLKRETKFICSKVIHYGKILDDKDVLDEKLHKISNRIVIQTPSVPGGITENIDGKMTLRLTGVFTPLNKEYTEVTVESSDRIDVICEELGYSSVKEQIKFIFAGKLLVHDRIFADYNIQKDSTIRCLF